MPFKVKLKDWINSLSTKRLRDVMEDNLFHSWTQDLARQELRRRSNNYDLAA